MMFVLGLAVGIAVGMIIGMSIILLDLNDEN